MAAAARSRACKKQKHCTVLPFCAHQPSSRHNTLTFSRQVPLTPVYGTDLTVGTTHRSDVILMVEEVLKQCSCQSRACGVASQVQLSHVNERAVGFREHGGLVCM